MNVHTPEIDRKPSREDAEAALAVLRHWAGRASDEEIAALDPSVGNLLPGQGYPVLSRAYPSDFVVTEAYKATLPDLQNGPASLIRGEKAVIQHVGISNFPPADPVPHPRQWSGDAGNQRDRHGQP
jgi:GTP cyclohydrolase I